MSDDIEDPNLKARIAAANEKAKLEATALNNIAVALAVAGVIAPLIAWAYDMPAKPNLSQDAMLFSIVFWAVVAFGIHNIGKSLLSKIR